MRVLVENSGYHLKNLGDVAMLQAAVERLADLWPGARIDVLTLAPERLAAFCPAATPMDPLGRALWQQDFNLFGPLNRLAPRSARPALLRLEHSIRLKAPRLAAAAARRQLRRHGTDPAPMHQFLDAVAGADLVVAAGGGYVTDVFAPHCLPILRALALAQRLGTPTAMLGQGLGPITDPTLAAVCRTVLPKIDFITLRESLGGLPLLRSIGFEVDSPRRLVVTGDDAIERAYEGRPERLGDGIGFNVRLAGYAEVDTAALPVLRGAMTEAAKARSAPLIATPIARDEGHDDVESIGAVLGDALAANNDGAGVTTPAHAIAAIGRCRVVVTGSYHAGVFALSQGIPVVGLSRGSYYRGKFAGLSGQFPGGCQIVRLDSPGLRSELTQAISQAWDAAPQLRPALWAEAEKQIATGRAAYRALREMVEAGRKEPSGTPARATGVAAVQSSSCGS